MKRAVVYAIVAVIVIALIPVIFVTGTALTSNKNQEFYVGVTYCGNSTAEAEMLINKVKGYTNLFVLQSGTLLGNSTAINEIGDHVANAGMNYIIYFGTSSAWAMKRWSDSYDGRWGNSFLGVYFDDEPGGRMLDSNRWFHDPVKGGVGKDPFGSIQWSLDDETQVTFDRDGTIKLSKYPYSDNFIEGIEKSSTFVYYPNGTVTFTTYKAKVVSETLTEYIESTIPLIDYSVLEYGYQELYNARPFQSYEETAQMFVQESKSAITNFGTVNGSVLTSDYSLYWYDYLAGYDTVLAQLGWNHSTVQDIALVRGAANMQNKSWGTIITWKYDQEPYLNSGQEIYDQIQLSYECGAKYIVIFNYAENMTGPYGILQEEHFQALGLSGMAWYRARL